MTVVQPPDLELWLCTYLRAELAAGAITDVEVDNREPFEAAASFPEKLIVVRDDSGDQTSVVSWERQLGISILAGTKIYDRPAVELARRVFGILTEDDGTALALADGSPIVTLLSARGPWRIDEPQDRTRMYMTIEYVVAADLL